MEHGERRARVPSEAEVALFATELAAILAESHGIGEPAALPVGATAG